MNERILEARDRHDRRMVELAHRAHPALSPWELGALLHLDEHTVRAHLDLLERVA